MTRKIAFFQGWSWFKFSNLGLALGRNLKFCTSVAKGLKLKVRKFWGPNPTFVEVTEVKLVGGLFGSPPSWIGLTVIKTNEHLQGLQIDVIDNENITSNELNKGGLHFNPRDLGRLTINFIRKIKKFVTTWQVTGSFH